MPDISSDKAELVALWCETLLYGIYVVYFQQAFKLVISRAHARNFDQRAGINWYHISVSLAIFLVASAHLFIVFARVIQAFILFRDSPGGPTAYFNNLKTGLEVSQASTQVVVSFLGDCMAIYRVFIVYSRSYLAISVPLVSLLGTTVASIASVVVIGKASAHDSVVTFYLPELETWMPIFFGLTFCTSVMCTLLIVIRLSFAQRRAKEYSTKRTVSQFATIQRLMIESASLYSGLMLIYLVTYMRKTNYTIIFGDMVAPVIGIAFSLITIRMNDAFVTQDSTPSTDATHLSSVRFAVATQQGTDATLRTEKDVSGNDSDIELHGLKDNDAGNIPSTELASAGGSAV